MQLSSTTQHSLLENKSLKKFKFRNQLLLPFKHDNGKMRNLIFQAKKPGPYNGIFWIIWNR